MSCDKSGMECEIILHRDLKDVLLENVVPRVDEKSVNKFGNSYCASQNVLILRHFQINSHEKSVLFQLLIPFVYGTS